MDLTATPLDQLGSHAHGHYRAAEKAKEKAEQNYISAGLYLKEAKLRVLKTRGMTFEKFLKDHCPIGRSRAYEVIAIADGRKTVEEVRESKAQSMRETRARRAEAANVHNVADKQPEKPNKINDSSPQDAVREAENVADAHLDALRKEVLALVNKANGAQLLHIRKAIINVLS